MEITDVTVSILKDINKPPLHLFEQVAIIKDGEGTIEQAVQGGQLTVTVRLKKGTETPAYKLKDGEGVVLTGTASGTAVSYPGLLITYEAEKHHWKFVGHFGSTGP